MTSAATVETGGVAREAFGDKMSAESAQRQREQRSESETAAPAPVVEEEKEESEKDVWRAAAYLSFELPSALDGQPASAASLRSALDTLRGEIDALKRSES